MADLQVTARLIARWAANAQINFNPQMPAQFRNRASDNWRVLIGIADAISPQAGKVARQSAVVMSVQQDEDIGVILTPANKQRRSFTLISQPRASIKPRSGCSSSRKSNSPILTEHQARRSSVSTWPVSLTMPCPNCLRAESLIQRGSLATRTVHWSRLPTHAGIIRRRNPHGLMRLMHLREGRSGSSRDSPTA